MTFTTVDPRRPSPLASMSVRLVMFGLLVAASVLGWPGIAQAHGGISLTVSGDGHGAVSVTALWGDGHPVTEAVGAILTATSDSGERIGPAGLRRSADGPGVLRFAGPLSAGVWSVVIDVGSPGIARCEARLTVGATVAPSEAPAHCPGAPEKDDGVAAGRESGSGALGLRLALVAVGVLAAGAFLFAVLRRRAANPSLRKPARKATSRQRARRK